MNTAPPADGAPAASLVVIDPNGRRSRVDLEPVPFLIGRHADNHLIIRDTRASRNHARILLENGQYVLEDCGSRHGTVVNGQAVKRHVLRNSDKIEFGVADSYQLIFAVDGAELKRLMDQVSAPDGPAPPGVGGNLAKLRAILDLARTLQSSFSVDDVLRSVVDTAPNGASSCCATTIRSPSAWRATTAAPPWTRTSCACPARSSTAPSSTAASSCS